MQFIKNGPDIPDRLLQAHEDGRVVFFCGAGISYPARLPGFSGLVTKLYAALGETPSAIQQGAIKAGQYDTAIALLEASIVGGREIVRLELVRILSPDLAAPNATATHEALLTLGRNREGRCRLITTNFDRLFEEVIAARGLATPRFQAPLLPVPKNRWDGLVYLHGLLPLEPTASELDCLVVASGDFGLAYLTERWAARFVSELFRNYTVCFVGYSINDPVLRYMMDALAADRLLGESPPEMFAFGSFSKGREEDRANEWKAKNVTPILYREHNRHTHLHRTLRTWAETYRDGARGKERIVAEYAMAKPLASTKQDDFVGRMLWALSDQRALPAKHFADHDPVPPLEWLEPLTETRFKHDDLVRFGVSPNVEKNNKLAFSVTLRPASYDRAPWMALVYSGKADGQWDDVMRHLARWLAKHLDNPKLVLWVAKHGGRLHGQFAWFIRHALEEKAPSPLMQILWRVVLSGRLQGHGARFDLYDWRAQFKRDGLTPTLRLELRAILSPRVQLREPIHGWEGNEEDDVREPSRIKDLVDWEMVLGTDHVHSALKDVVEDEKWHEVLPDLLFDATGLLCDTLDLMRELGAVDDRHDMSYMHQPSISDHPQNNDFRDWTVLINLAREAWLATVRRFPERALLEAERWWTTPYPLFKRLVFFAATTTELFAPAKALAWLLADDNWWLWSVETEREVLRLLVALAPRLDAEQARLLGEAILQGPPRDMFKEDTEAERLRRIIDREIWLRLAKCQAVGARLGADAAARLAALSRQYPMWQLSRDERDEFPFWMGGDEEWREFLEAPKKLHDLVDWLRKHQTPDTWKPDNWSERCKHDFRRTASALMHLASKNEWFVERWREALQTWADDKLQQRSWRYMGTVLNAAPDDDLRSLAHAVSWWLKAIAKTFEGHERIFFDLVRRVVQLHRSEELEADDPVFKAINHPIGHVTEAALSWWYRRSLEDGQGLPGVIKPLFTDLCDVQIAGLRHGRVLLAAHVIALFRVDRDWAVLYLLPLFDWQRSASEARAAWDGFLWAPRLYRPLMEAIKQPFLATAEHYADLGKHAEQYAALLTFAALEPGDTFSKAELATATRALPPDGLRSAAQTVVRALEGAGDQRGEYWRNRVLPYLKAIWPKSRNVITPAISENLARLCVAAQGVFPEALDELKHWLQPSDHPEFVVHLLHEAKLPQQFPEAALVFLNAVIGDKVQWPPTNLKDCLDAIQLAQPNLSADNRFQRLLEFLQRH